MPTDSNSAAAIPSPPASFQLKGGLFPLTLLEVSHFDKAIFEQDLKDKAAQAPTFFQQSPVLLGFDELEQSQLAETDPEPIPLAELCQLCRDYGLVPVAVRGGSEALQQLALAQGLALMPASRSTKPAKEKVVANTVERDTPLAAVNSAEVESPQSASTPAAQAASASGHSAAEDRAASADDLPSTALSNTKVVTAPVRSGQQVYAAGGDLIILSSVSAGAEILADGNIHVYGPLRGRALAGVKGNSSARVFCYSLEAELVSIAGSFQLYDDLQGEHWNKPAQISLDNEKISIQSLT